MSSHPTPSSPPQLDTTTLKRPLKVVDLFCGAGGLSLGFEYHGCEPMLAVDHDAQAIETYNANRPTHPVGRVLDVHELTTPLKDVDLVVGGPPCQGFSTANRRRLIDDPRNVLYKQFIRLVDLYQPRAVIMENVVGITHHAQEIIDDYLSIGYDACYVTLNAAHFGVPQSRKRVFFFACKTPKFIERFKSLEGYQSERRHVLRDALQGLRPLLPKQTKNSTHLEGEAVGYTRDPHPGGHQQFLHEDFSRWINRGRPYPAVTYNHKSRYHNERDIEIFRRLPQGGDSTHESVQELMPYHHRGEIFKDKYYRLVEERPCRTITAHMRLDCNMYIHPTQPRGLTPREAARVQTFPDDYEFKGAYTRWYQQIGNAVPPMLSYAVAGELLSYEELFW